MFKWFFVKRANKSFCIVLQDCIIKYHFLIFFVLTYLIFLKFCVSTVGGSSVHFHVVVKASEIEGSWFIVAFANCHFVICTPVPNEGWVNGRHRNSHGKRYGGDDRFQKANPPGPPRCSLVPADGNERVRTRVTPAILPTLVINSS